MMRMRALADDNKDRKVVFPPRLCTLRSFADSGGNVMKPEPQPDRMSSFFNSLAASIDHAAKFKDWEILSGRFAMIVFAAAINVELLTRNSLFHKMDMQKICEFGGICMASIVGAGFCQNCEVFCRETEAHGPLTVTGQRQALTHTMSGQRQAPTHTMSGQRQAPMHTISGQRQAEELQGAQRLKKRVGFDTMLGQE